MEDYIVRATAANNQIRAFASVTTGLVEEVKIIIIQVNCNSCLRKIINSWWHDGVCLKAKIC